jgi:hypothetical protein
MSAMLKLHQAMQGAGVLDVEEIRERITPVTTFEAHRLLGGLEKSKQGASSIPRHRSVFFPVQQRCEFDVVRVVFSSGEFDKISDKRHRGYLFLWVGKKVELMVRKKSKLCVRTICLKNGLSEISFKY